MKKNKFLCILITAVFFMASCDLLDRPNPNDLVDSPGFWRNEASLRLFAQEFYPQFFVGFNSGWAVDFTPVRGLTFEDGLVQAGAPAHFPAMAPASVGGAAWNTGWNGPVWAGPTWNFYWIRKANMMIDRLERYARGELLDEVVNHWEAKARFFKALHYSRLVSVFGDVPWFENYFLITNREEMFRPRDSRNVVMDNVYDEFRFALANLRARGGNTQELNRDVAAAFISRWMLFEGSWQWFHNQDAERAVKFLNFAVEASEFLMNSGRYNITTEIRALFSQFTPTPANPEVIMWRTYNNPGLMHHIASYNNLQNESQTATANLDLIKSFITTDGDVWQNVAGADNFALANLIATRDPRFEATFAPVIPSNPLRAPSGLYTVRFISRNAINLAMAGQITTANHPQYTGATNTNAFPIVRLGEVLLNWIEARAILAEAGGDAVEQEHIDRSINVLRNRPVHPEAALRGVTQTAPMLLASLPNDPERTRIEGVTGQDISPLMWEIRRERRMELFQEVPRMLDLRRWNTIEKMNTELNPNIVLGAWVDIQAQQPDLLTEAAAGNSSIQVRRLDGTTVIYDGTNAAQMIGFRVVNLSPASAGIQIPRPAFDDRVYLAPLGTTQIDLYREAGFYLSQNPGW